MNFLIYQRDHKETFKTLNLKYIDIEEFFIKVTITVKDDIGRVLTKHPGAAAHVQEATQEAVAAALAGPIKSLKRWLVGQEHAIGTAQLDAVEGLRVALLREFQGRRSAITAEVGETAAKAAIDDIAGFMAKSDNAATLELRVQAITDVTDKTSRSSGTPAVPRKRLLRRAKRLLEAIVVACETESARAKQRARVAGGGADYVATDAIANLARRSSATVVNLIAALKDDAKLLEETTARARVGFNRLSQRLPDLLDAQDELLAELKKLDDELGPLGDADGTGNNARERIEKTKKKLERIEGATERILLKLEELGAFIAAEETFIEGYHRTMRDLGEMRRIQNDGIDRSWR